MGKKSSKNNYALVRTSFETEEKEMFWREITIKVKNTLWLIRFNLRKDKVICRQIYFHKRYGLVYKNPIIDLSLKKMMKRFLKESGYPKNLWKNTFNSALKEIENESQKVKLNDTKRKIKRGRPRENYFRVATLDAIKKHKLGTPKTKTIKKVFPKFQKQASSEANFITRVLQLWRETQREYTEVTDHFTFLEFAKSHLKQTRNTRKP